MTRKRLVGAIGLAGLALCAGCVVHSGMPGEPQTRESLSLLMPEKIGIMPFTRIESFDDDARPDGITLLLRPINMLGDPVNIVGNVRAELFDFVPASGQPKGDRLATWDNIALATKEDQLRHWSSITQMYEFRLAFDTDAMPKRSKYVLEVTYTTPLGTHLTDEYTLEPPIATETFAASEKSEGS